MNIINLALSIDMVYLFINQEFEEINYILISIEQFLYLYLYLYRN